MRAIFTQTTYDYLSPTLVGSFYNLAMTEAKDIDDSLEFLRYFEKYSENPDLASLVQEKLSVDKTKLDLRSCALKEEEFKLLAEMKPLGQLKLLVLNQTKLTSAGLKHLCFSPVIQQLETLHLANNNLDDEGIFYLSKSPVFTLITSLISSVTNIISLVHVVY